MTTYDKYDKQREFAETAGRDDFDDNEDFEKAVDITLIELYNKLRISFKEVTSKHGNGLELSMDYHDSENGSDYDTVDGYFWQVTGVYEKSIAGKYYGEFIEEESFVCLG